MGEILPEIVQYEENGEDAFAMDYTKVVALVLEAFNVFKAEHDDQIMTLEQQIADLQEQINALQR